MSDSLSDAWVTAENGKRTLSVTNRGNESSLYPPINKWGTNIDTDTADSTIGQVIWPIKATVQPYVFLDSPITARLISTSINDASGGTGARSVKIYYHDVDNVQKEIILDPNGITGTLLPEVITGCFRMTIENSGGLHSSDGIVKIINESGGNIIALIEAGYGQSRIAVQKVPKGMKGVVTYHKTSFIGTNPVATATIRLVVRKTDGTLLNKWEPELSSTYLSDERIYRDGGIEVKEGEHIFWKCVLSSTNDLRIRGTFDIKFIG